MSQEKFVTICGDGCELDWLWWSFHHNTVVHLKLTSCYVSITCQLKRRNIIGFDIWTKLWMAEYWVHSISVGWLQYLWRLFSILKSMLILPSAPYYMHAWNKCCKINLECLNKSFKNFPKKCTLWKMNIGGRWDIGPMASFYSLAHSYLSNEYFSLRVIDEVLLH